MSVVKWDIPSTASDISSRPLETDSAKKLDDPVLEKPHTGPRFTPARRPEKLAYSRGRRSNQSSYPKHTSSILCAAASTTGRFLATGGLDRRIVIWDVSMPSSLKPIKVF